MLLYMHNYAMRNAKKKKARANFLHTYKNVADGVETEWNNLREGKMKNSERSIYP